MKLGQNIAMYRKESGLTQEQLAEKCEVSRQAVTKWESGISEPSIAKLIRLSEIFSVSIDTLLNGKKEEAKLNHAYYRFIYMAIMPLWGADKDEKLKELDRILALKALYKVVETEFMNAQGKIYEKYLVKNTTEEERKQYMIMPSRIITPKEEWNPFDDYIKGKCEVIVGFQEIEERLEKELKALQPGD